jgi:hypothetical protein
MEFTRICIIQYLRAKKAATPEQIQSSGCESVGSSMYITKFVEWPVVERVPDLLTTL